MKKRTAQSFANDQVKLGKEFKTLLSNPINDGALCPKSYFNSDPKIMWLMKEAYDPNNELDFITEFGKSNDDIFDKFIRGGSAPTWKPIMFITHGVYNNLTTRKKMGDANPNMIDSLRKVAFVNIQKCPSTNGDGTRTKMSDIWHAYKSYNKLIHKQIELLNPDIIVCANTFDIVKDDLLINLKTEKHYNHTSYYIGSNNRTIIDAWHPANTIKGLTKELYINEMSHAIQHSLKVAKY